MTYFLYVKTHSVTGLKYLGKTVQNPTKYKGSGKVWRQHLKEFGVSHVTEIIGTYSIKEELAKAGREYSKLHNIKESPLWANLIPETGGGPGGPFRKGIAPWNKGLKKEDDIRIAIGIKKSSQTKTGMKNKPCSEARKLLISKSKLGKKRNMTWKSHVRPCIISNISYSSVKEASEKLNLTRYQVEKLLR